MTTTAHPAAGAGPLVRRLADVPGREERLTHLEELPPREAVTAPWPEWAALDVVAAFRARGVEQPWRHQVVAADAAHAGQHVVLATGTASGKSLAYQLPALSAVRSARGARGQRGATVLYVAPTKALAQDQLSRVRDLGLDVRVATHDGDSSREQRDWARDHGEYLLTNPDMLHRSMLPSHQRWARFLGSLTYVVVDECHHYRGVFGAHVAHVLRRLRRICASYGASPTFVLASATMAEPEQAGRRLTGLDVLPVTADSSPRGRVSLALWQPPLTSHAGENGAPVRRAASSETADLLADLVASEVRTLAFVRSRVGAEQVALTAQALLAEVDPSLPGRVASYRGGYLPEERRAIEEALRSGELLGLAATNALELGIDISGLDAVLMAGYPGTRAALWQQLGRAGRGAGDALGVLVARDDPLDTYLVTHPEALIGAPVEAGVFDPGNPYVLGPHLCAAAQEIPLTEADFDLFGPTTGSVVASLTQAGLLRKRPHGWFWTDRRRAADLADIRSTGGTTVQLVEAETGRVVGTVDSGRAHSTAHAGAVYLHRGETYLVEELDLDEHVAVLHRADPAYSTTARETTDISIVAEHRASAGSPWARSTSPTRWWPSFADASPAVRCWARSRSTCRCARCAPPRSGGPCPSGCSTRAASPPATSPARRTPRSTARSGCCRSSPPVTAGTSAGSAPPDTPTHRRADRLRLRRPPRRSGLRRAWLRSRPRVADRDPRDDRVLRVRPGLSLLHPVAQVRQPEQPTRQGRGGRTAGGAARQRLSPGQCPSASSAWESRRSAATACSSSSAPISPTRRSANAA
jgi:DEAD/DEAH box helicase domain-containing protein